jgi:hypothetical protein
MSRKVYHKIWKNPPHPFEGQPGNYKVKEEVVNSRKGALMITNSNRAYFYKVLVCGLQEVLPFFPKSCRSGSQFNASTYKSLL